jgi:hypothetical protein
MRTISTLTLVAVLALAPAPASACGGLFCSNRTQPVNQKAERIVFSVDADGAVHALIEIQYEGSAQHFAWVLPVAGAPTVGVSSRAVLDRIQLATDPQYLLTTTVEGECRDRPFPTYTNGPGMTAADAGGASDTGAAHVGVVEQGTVGPYDYVVIHVDPSATPLSQVALDWLNTNGYLVDPAGAALYEPYLEGGSNLLAFRLTSGASTTSIRPITLDFGTGLASIPIRPTAVAAQDDMGVMVFVLGASRAVPVNYASLELDDALIDWLRGGANYGQLVTQAANEAGGQAFVTEMSGDAAPFAATIWPSYSASWWADASTGGGSTSDGQFIATAIGALSGLDGLGDVVVAHVPPPPGISMAQFLTCPTCYAYQYYGVGAVSGFDRAAFIDALRTQVVQPMIDARTLFTTHARLTRFYTTMSASEMTLDPAFDFNPALPGVSNVHTATRTIECSPSLYTVEAPWRVLLPDGRVVRGTGSTWPFTASMTTLPANERVLRMATTGSGAVLTDNRAIIDGIIARYDATQPRGDFLGAPIVTGAGGGGCSVGARGGAMGATIVMGVIALALRRRRRR